MMNRCIKTIIDGTEEVLCRGRLVCGESPSLITVLFHGLINPEQDAGLTARPLSVTCDNFRVCLRHFKQHGYTFVSPDDLVQGLDPSGRHVMISFDDGYRNNLQAVPVLKELNVPAVFFISTYHVIEQVGYWWDTLHRELKMRGKSDAEIWHLTDQRKTMTHEQIEAHLVNEFGGDSLKPRGEEDRPMTVDELKAFSQEREVFVENHTRHHAILTNYDEAGIRQEINSAQKELEDITGHRPVMVAYPNGNSSPTVYKVVAECGLPFGITVEPGKNRLPLSEKDYEPMRLKRFVTNGQESMTRQCIRMRSDFTAIRRLRERWR